MPTRGASASSPPTSVDVDGRELESGVSGGRDADLAGLSSGTGAEKSFELFASGGSCDRGTAFAISMLRGRRVGVWR